MASRRNAQIDVIVVGAGPNGLAAAVTAARAGLRVRVYERAGWPGGGAATRELTLPGFHHDVGAAIHPLAFASHFFREFGLRDRVRFVTPDVSFAQPLVPGHSAIAYRDVERTADRLGRDGATYTRLLRPLVDRTGGIAALTGGSLLRIPRDLVAAGVLAARALEQGSRGWGLRFRDAAAPALLTGASAHTLLPQPSIAAAGAGLVLTAYAHAEGWPVPIGGSGAIIAAMVADLEAHGGEIVSDHEVADLAAVPRARAILLDVTPRAFVRLAGPLMPARYRQAMERFRYGAGVAKVDFALGEPVPWADADLRRAGTVHLGGTRAEMVAAEREVLRGGHPERPYVLVAQPSAFDPTRAPAGRHTLWTYTHVPAGSPVDRREAVINQIERFAPGFRDTVLAVSSRTAVGMEQVNPNHIGGDISSGAPTLGQLFARPVVRTDPWRTPIPGVYLASASTAPGPGVHGLAGWHAAQSALRNEFGIRTSPDLSPTAATR